MKVIVNISGFYGGTWFKACEQPQDMKDAVAKQFLPPHGDQLALPTVEAQAEKPAARRGR